MTVKELYTTPVVKVLLVRVEGVICGSGFGAQGAAGADPDFNDYSEF